ncbi:unnamed protein product [Phytophthora fragariaefolia]|uniref:Unnamed protein product n=1 Tax=Phytophthora fragariaefolia TaxID=1490495 RepID=A0A9W6XMS5_9STRA|nr:unnamed protein product [Phytophthora fragariaefolia]
MEPTSSALPERVSYVEAHRLFLALESPSAAVGDSSSPAFQDELTRALRYVKRCAAQRQRDGVLSSNERLFELQNAQLYALCLEFYLGLLAPKQSFFQAPADEPKGPADHTRNVVARIAFLREADVFLTQFLDTAERCGALQEKARREQYERLEARRFSLSRDEKVRRFQLQREVEKKLHAVQKRRQERGDEHVGAARNELTDELDDDEDDAEDLEREMLMTFIQLAVLKSMEEQASINQEKDMLETMLKMNVASDKQDLFSEAHRPPPPPQGQGITIRSGVFKPGHRLPTMTLEEYADRELADAQERQKREQYVAMGLLGRAKSLRVDS